MNFEENTTLSIRRSPLLAALLSFAATGLGHIYCGKLTKGLVLFSIGFTFGPVIVSQAFNIHSTFALLTVIGSVALLFAVFFYAIIDAVFLARKTGDDYDLKEYNKWYIYLIFIVFSISYPTNVSNSIKDHVFQAFVIPSSSMVPSILKRDYILLNKSIYRREAPKVGDIIVFPNPNNRSRDFLKRIVAMPGDAIEIKNHVVYINDTPLEYQAVEKAELAEIERQIDGRVVREVNRETAYKIMLSDAEPGNFRRTIVPNGHCFVLGDNRSNAKDSRNFGPVPLADVKGRADYIYLPAETWSRFGRYRD